MSTGVAVAGSADGTVTVVTTTANGADEHNAANTSTASAGASGAGGKQGQITLTPRFTQEEKEILYSLFHEHEEVIDIKFRKKQRSKYSVRDAWEKIVHEFNTHPGVSAMRNLKQIQKFWLNARLRKQYPFRPNGQKDANSSQTSIDSDRAEVVNHQIKDEPDFQVTNMDPDEHGSQNEAFEEIEMDTSDGVGQLEQEPIDPLQQQQQQLQQQQQQQQHQQQVLQQHVQQQQQQQQQQTLQTQQISVDQISAEKLTLNDLLQFKTTRPREDIILQIKHPVDSNTTHITIPSPTRITIPSQHQPQQHTITAMPATAYNQQIISEIKPQQITLAQYQAQQLQQQQQQLAQHQLAVAAQQQQQQQQQQQHQIKMQLQSPATAQFATATPTFTCTTLHALPVATAPAPAPVVPTVSVSNAAVAATTPGNTTITVESFEEKVQYFRLKEAELRYKETQVALEQKKIELSRAQEDLKHLREVHRLQVEELKMKIRILQEEEKLLRKSPSAVQV